MSLLTAWWERILDALRRTSADHVDRGGVVDLTPRNVCRIDRPLHNWHGRVVSIESQEPHARVLVRDGRNCRCMFGVEDLAPAQLGDEQAIAHERAARARAQQWNQIHKSVGD